MSNFVRLKDEDETAFINRLRLAYDARKDEWSEDYHPEVKHYESCRRIHNREFNYKNGSVTQVRTKMGKFRAESKNNLIDIDDFKAGIAEKDTQREYRNELRKEARAETIQAEIVDAVARTYQTKINIPRTINPNPEGPAMIPVLSDWHFGANHTNYLAEYSVDIAKERIALYAKHIVAKAKQDKVSEIILLNTGDLVEGMIHVSTRIQAELNIIDQTIQLSEALVQFISYILENVDVPVRYGSVLDNHSRVHPNKKDAIEKESFGKIIEWYVKSRFEEGQIDFIENVIDDNIGYVDVKGMKVAYVHGHMDTVKASKDKLSRIVGTLVDIVIISHRHHVATLDGVYQSGSLKGVDEYAFNFRASDAPSQMIISIQDGEYPYIDRRDVYFDLDYAKRYEKINNKK